jgi:DNA polymerase-3 subunit epsilon
MPRPIYYDTETTGVKPSTDRIIELAAFDPELDKSFSTLINPQIPIPKEATKIHNITDEMVKPAPLFKEIIPDFINFLGTDFVLIAHNNDAFDVHFLRNEFSIAGENMPDWKFIDSLKWARKFRPDLPRHSLQFLREVYGFEANQAHRALDDVIILHRVFSELIDDLSWDCVFQLLNAPIKITHMPFGKHQGKLLNQVPKDYVVWLEKSGALDKSENKALKQAFESLGFFQEVVKA